MRRWTVLLYLAGADDLEPQIAGTLLALEKAGPPPDLEVVVQIARASGTLLEPLLPGRPPTGIDGDWHGVRRYRLTARPPGGSDRIYHSELLADLGTVCSADPGLLADFVRTSVQAFPAERTLLAISGHGMGFVGLAMEMMTGPHPWLMSIRGLATTLRSLEQQPDLLLLDACQMNAIEIGCELAVPRPAAGWLITPASRAPRAGMDYPALLSVLGSAGEHDSLREVAARLAQSLEQSARQQVLALGLDPERWRAAAAAARAEMGAEAGPHPAIFREILPLCAYPPPGHRLRLLMHRTDSPHFPPKYHHLYRRLRFARLSGWHRLLPSGGRERPRPSRGPIPAPLPLLAAWLRQHRPALTQGEAEKALRSLGWEDPP